MGLETMVLAAVGIWGTVMLFVVALGRAAKWSDHDMETDLPRFVAESQAVERTLRTLDLGQAAALLGVAPETLLTWEARYGFPTSSPSERLYNQSEVLTLRDKISSGFSIAAAIASAREGNKRRRRPTEAWDAGRRGGGLAS